MSEPDPLKPVYLIVGSDRPKVRRAVQQLRRRVIAESGSDINVASFEVEKLTTAATLRALIEAADSPGFALGTRLLLVFNAHQFNVKERKELLAYIHDPMPGTTLALEAEKWAKDDALYKTVFKAGGVLSYDLPKRYEMAGWVRERAAAKRLPMSVAVARHLLDVCGEDPGHSERLEREIEKLALYCRGAEAAVEDVDAVCTPDDEARIFDLMDAVGHRDRTRAFGLLETIFASGDPQEDANRVLYGLLRYVRSSRPRGSSARATRGRPRSSWACTPSRPRSCWSSARTTTGAASTRPTGRWRWRKPGCAGARRPRSRPPPA